MNRSEINRRAREEAKLSLHTLNSILKKIQLYPNGADIKIPPSEVDIAEQYCDSKGIPLYVVEFKSGCVSVAKTYSLLAIHETSR